MATSLSEPTKKRILQVCVKLFLEQGYKKTTMAEIIEKSSVSSSSFQNIFRAKDGVLTELVQFMFENQFSMARSAASTMLPPVYVYAVETAIQMTLTELTLEKKLRLFFTMSLRAYNVPEEEIGRVIRFVEGLDIRAISEQVMQKLFKALAMHYEFSLQGIM